LDPPALVIYGDQQRRLANRPNLAHQRLKLLNAREISREQNEAANQRVTKYFAIFGGQRSTGHIDHEWTECH
jgi:hypothetical protein